MAEAAHRHINTWLTARLVAGAFAGGVQASLILHAHLSSH